METKDSQVKTWWVYLLVAAAMAPALCLRDFTPDNELRYLEIADGAIADGSVWCFSYQGAYYADKPPLYIWLAMLGKMLFGKHFMWWMGIFSLVPMLVTGLVMDRWCLPLAEGSKRITTLLTLFTCGYFPLLALTLRMDMLMTMFIVLAVRQVWMMSEKGCTFRRGALLGLWTFLALFTKGPFGVVFPLLGSLVWLISVKRIRDFFRIWNWGAWLVILAGCAVWFGCAYAEGGGEYLDNLLFHQTVDRAHNAFHHKRPFWYYAVAIWYVCAPWSLIWLWQAVRNGSSLVSGPMRRLLLCTAATAFAVVSCVSSKLQVYLLPCIPFLVWLFASLPGSASFQKGMRIAAYTLLGLIFAAGLAMPWVNPMIGFGPAAGEIARLRPDTVVVDTRVKNGADMAVYLDCPVISADTHAVGFRAPARSVTVRKDTLTSNKICYEPNF